MEKQLFVFFVNANDLTTSREIIYDRDKCLLWVTIIILKTSSTLKKKRKCKCVFNILSTIIIECNSK